MKSVGKIRRVWNGKKQLETNDVNRNRPWNYQKIRFFLAGSEVGGVVVRRHLGRKGHVDDGVRGRRGGGRRPEGRKKKMEHLITSDKVREHRNGKHSVR